MLFDFEIKYRAEKTNQAADDLSRRPENPNSSSESSDDEEEWDTISYEMVCRILNHHLDSTKLHYHVKHEGQSNIMEVDKANHLEGFKLTNIVNVQLKEVKIFNSIRPEQMAELQKKDPQLSLVYDKILSKTNPRLSEIHHIRSKPTHRLLLQYDQLSLIWGVLHHSIFKESVLGLVWVGNTCQAICIPANSMKVVQGRTLKVTWWLSCMVEARVCHNLPRGIVVNRTMVTPHKNKQVPVALMNTKTYNVWICQLLLVANIVEAEDCPWDYQSSMSRDGNKINISFCPVPSTEVQAEIVAVSVTKAEPGKKLEMTHEGGERPKFGSQPDFNNQNFDFRKE